MLAPEKRGCLESNYQEEPRRMWPTNGVQIKWVHILIRIHCIDVIAAYMFLLCDAMQHVKQANFEQ